MSAVFVSLKGGDIRISYSYFCEAQNDKILLSYYVAILLEK